MSEKRQQKLYEAIADPIMTERIEIEKHNMSKGEVDTRLFNLQIIIWRRVHAVLNLQSIP